MGKGEDLLEKKVPMVHVYQLDWDVRNLYQRLSKNVTGFLILQFLYSFVQVVCIMDPSKKGISRNPNKNVQRSGSTQCSQHINVVKP